MEPKIIKEGYVVITPTIFQGDIISWAIQEEGLEAMPEIFETERAAWVDIVKERIEILQEFVDGDIELDDLEIGELEDYVGFVRIYENGDMKVWNVDDCTIKGKPAYDQYFPTIDTTLNKWRAEL